jgi:hypothetical protein
MRSRCWNLAVIANLATLLAACGTGLEVAGKRQNLGALQQESERCRAASPAPGGFQACSARHGAALAKLAQESADEAAKAQNRATRIGLYALAANGGWESGMDAGFQVADTAIQAGTAECGRAAANEFVPPRDCALLRVGPGFVAHMRTLSIVDQIEAKPPASVSAAEKRQLAEVSIRYVRNTFDFVEGQRRQFEADPNLDQSVLALLDRQRSTFFCTALHVSTVNRRLGQIDAARRVSRDRDRFFAVAPALQGERCVRTG